MYPRCLRLLRLPLPFLFLLYLLLFFLLLSLANQPDSRSFVLYPARSLARSLARSSVRSFVRSFARNPPFLSGQITPHDLRCNLQSAVRMYTAISPCKYATLFRMRMHSRLFSTLSPLPLVPSPPPSSFILSVALFFSLSLCYSNLSSFLFSLSLSFYSLRSHLPLTSRTFRFG